MRDTVIFGAWLLTACVGIACAQDLPDSEADLPQEPIDEVVAYGDKSLATLRQAVYRAEEDFWAAFSAINDDDDFDVTCFEEAPPGTRIRRHVCRAKFVTEARGPEYEAWRTQGPRVVVRDAQTVVMARRREFEERVTQLILENPKLAQAITRYHDARDTYASERERQCEGRLIACRR